MSRRPPHLGRDRRGATAVEFALIAPVLIAFLLGVAQLGVLFFANAGLQNALAEGARLATIFPRPSEAAVAAKITQQRFGLDPARLTDPSFAYGTTNGMTYADISLSYTMPLNLWLVETPPITLTQSRRVYIQPAA